MLALDDGGVVGAAVVGAAALVPPLPCDWADPLLLGKSALCDPDGPGFTDPEPDVVDEQAAVRAASAAAEAATTIRTFTRESLAR